MNPEHSSSKRRNVCAVCCERGSTVSYFLIPSDQRRELWLNALNFPPNVPKWTRICSKHFTNNDYHHNKIEVKKKRLIKDAIPSLFLDHLQCEKENRCSVSTNKNSKLHCVICGPIKSDCSSHRFPIDEDRRRIWLQILGIDRKYPEDKISNKRICSEHFCSSDFLETPWTKVKILKANAIPIKVQTSDVQVHSKPHQSLIAESSNIDPEIETSDLEPRDRQLSAVQLYLAHLQSYVEEIDNVDIESADPVSNVLNGSTVLLSENNSQATTTDTSSNNNIEESNNIVIEMVVPVLSTPTINSLLTPSTPTTGLAKDLRLGDHGYVRGLKKRNMFTSNVRYVRDVRSPHLSTPRRAKKCWNMALEKLSSQEKKISALQRKLRKSLSKVKTLQDIIIHLRERRMISDSTIDELLVCSFSDVD